MQAWVSELTIMDVVVLKRNEWKICVMVELLGELCCPFWNHAYSKCRMAVFVIVSWTVCVVAVFKDYDTVSRIRT